MLTTTEHARAAHTCLSLQGAGTTWEVMRGSNPHFPLWALTSTCLRVRVAPCLTHHWMEGGILQHKRRRTRRETKLVGGKCAHLDGGVERGDLGLQSSHWGGVLGTSPFSLWFP